MTHTLQNLIWPEPGLNTERDLYVRLSPDAALSMRAGRVDFIAGARADFGTYCNLFNCGKWHYHCGLETLELCLNGSGRFELTVFHVRPGRSWERLVNEVITLTEDVLYTQPALPPHGFETRGVLFFEMTALSEGHLSDAHWQTQDAPRRVPELMLSVTTFRREAALARTAQRFVDFAAASPIGAHLHLTVIDNGQSADIPPAPNVTVIPNANFGGSGGFARGLLAAQERGASHCLFMDDDAAVYMEAVARTWAFLAFARDPATAIAGAVSDSLHCWRLWENGALFDQTCHPLHMGTDLRNVTQVLALEFDSTAPAPDNFYGGWWYFAFPLEAVQHMPFPFFVRGDDVSFSLSHDFTTVTLPGVISFQDENFSVKETPLTVYLDLRSHLAHHLALPQMEIGRVRLLKIILRFYLRSLIACHYDTLDAVALALGDVLAGPAYFAAHADLATRRSEIAALTDMERWRRTDDSLSTLRKRDKSPLPAHNILARLFMKCTLNGHLLPGFRHFGNLITLPSEARGQIRPLWGATRITYLSSDEAQSYTVTHSKRRAWASSRAILAHAWAILRDYEALQTRWRTGYKELTQPGFWHKALNLPDPDP